MATAIRMRGKTDLTIEVKSGRRQPTQTSQTSTMILKTYRPCVTRSESFVYQGLTLPPKIWSRVYDGLGNVVEENLSDSDGSLIFRWTYLLDKHGRKMRGNLHNRKGMLLASWFYDEHQRVNRRSHFNNAALAAAA